MRTLTLVVALTISAGACLGQGSLAAAGGDWPQLGGNAARTACQKEGVAPPLRARWIWCGPDKTLRSKAADPAWPDDLTKGHNYFAPGMKVNFTFSGGVQPVVANGKIFLGDMEGHVYAIALEDGSTLWTAANPGGTCASMAVVGKAAIATSILGAVAAYDVETGKPLWRFETPKAITGSPLVVGGKVFSGGHDGKVYALDAQSGKSLWTADLKAPIVADLCGDEQAVYVGAEDMYFHKLAAADGKELAKARLCGQSFRMEHPVLFQDMLFVQTVQAYCVGSEYVMEELMKDPSDTDIATEQKLILRWLSGDTNNGRWQDGALNPGAWKHLHVLKTADLTEPFIVPNGPADGCGTPVQPPCVDNEGRVLTWFKTKFPTLTKKGSFGTNFSMDISGIDLKTGLRVPIDKGHLSGETGETDNLFALSVGGPYLYLRQRFRGTWMIDLNKAQAYHVQATVTNSPGYYDVEYRANDPGDDAPDRAPHPAQADLAARPAVTIAGGKLLFTESYCLTCIEHRPN